MPASDICGGWVEAASIQSVLAPACHSTHIQVDQMVTVPQTSLTLITGGSGGIGAVWCRALAVRAGSADPEQVAQLFPPSTASSVKSMCR